MTIFEAERVAFIAHTACGQYRADGVTRYIEHPRKVADYVSSYNAKRGELSASVESGVDRMVAAYLHDVLEDTKLTREDLLRLGITYRQLDIVERLTKPDLGPSPASYYQAIAENDDALVVKCFDRCANLEDALAELLVTEPSTPRRWANYVEKTYRDVLPMYASLPILRSHLTTRLAAIEAALPGALERRAVVVERERAAAGV